MSRQGEGILIARIATLVFIVVLCPLVAAAQSSSKAVVNVTGSGPAEPVAAGASFETRIKLAIKSGYHINAQKPSEDYLIGTKVEPQPPAGIATGKISYPATRYATFSFSETPLAVYEGTVDVVVSMKTDASAAPGPASIPFKVTFQSCNHDQCLPPSTVEVTVAVTIVAAAETTPQGTPQIVALIAAPAGAAFTIDGKVVGKAGADGRLAVRSVEPGKHRVHGELEGYAPWDQSFEVKNTQVNLTVAMAQNAVTAPATVENTAPPAAEPAPPAATAPPPAETQGSRVPYVIAGIAILAIIAALGYFGMRKR